MSAQVEREERPVWLVFLLSLGLAGLIPVVYVWLEEEHMALRIGVGIVLVLTFLAGWRAGTRMMDEAEKYKNRFE